MPIERIPVTDRASWLAMRKQDVTASDIGAVCGVNPHRTPLRVYAEKTGLIEGDPENVMMRRGRWFEPAILEALRETFPAWRFERAAVYLRDPDLRIGATPDIVAIAPDRPGIGVIQTKVVTRRAWGRDWLQKGGEDEASEEDAAPIERPPTGPIYYQLQTITEAKLAEASWAALCAFVIGEFTVDLALIDVHIHDGAWERMKSEVAYFWRCVEEGRFPEPIPGRDLETLSRIYAVAADRPEPLDLNADNQLLDMLDERARISVQAKAIETRLDEIKQEVVLAMGDAPFAVCGPWNLSRKNETRPEKTVSAWSGRITRITRRRGS